MNPEIKKKWVEALRSGEYKQANETLRDDTGYCCLGVLCDLHSKETGVRWMTDNIESRAEYLGYTDHLPTPVVEWAGIDCPTRTYHVGGADVEVKIPEDLAEYLVVDTTLSAMNDAGVPFVKIADVIETQL